MNFEDLTQLYLLFAFNKTAFVTLVAVVAFSVVFVYFIYLLKHQKPDFRKIEKQEDEEFIRSLDIVPNHNYLVAYKGWNPSLFTLFKGDAFYESLISQRYLLVVTSDELIIQNQSKNSGQVQRFKHQEVENFQAGPMSLSSYHCVSFNVQHRKYYFYLDADDVFGTVDWDYSSTNYYMLVDENFFGLLPKEPVHKF